MEPGVPFALLGAVQLLVIVAASALAAVGWLRRSGPGALVVVGAVVLAGVEVRVALRLGAPASDNLALARAAASLLIAAGMYAGGLGGRRRVPPSGAVPGSMAGVVVPLAAASGPASFAAGAGVLAAWAASLHRRKAVAIPVSVGFTAWALASVLAPSARTGSTVPISIVLLRGLGAVLVMVGLAVLAQRSLLSKVVSAILVGVVTMAIAAVGVVGTVVVSSYDRQARTTVQDAASTRVEALDGLFGDVTAWAGLAAQVCSDPPHCQAFLERIIVNGHGDFVVHVKKGQEPVFLAGRAALSASDVLGVRGLSAVQDVLNGSGTRRVDNLADYARLTGPESGFAVIGVAAGNRAQSQAAPDDVWVYGVLINTDYTQRDLDINGFGLSILAGEPLRVVASNRSQGQQSQLLSIMKAHHIGSNVPDSGITIGSQGSAPTVFVHAIRSRVNGHGDFVALLAMTRDPGPALKTERDALRLLIGTSLLALIGVGVVAVLLGRRTVDPVRRLTDAAQRVAAGDLTANVIGVRAKDEVGTLAHTFDAMTGSLAQLTGDLRDSAARLATVLASMADGLLATDGAGLVTSVNLAGLEMLGVEEADVIGERLDVVADVRRAHGERVDLGSTLLDEPALVYRPDGTTVPVRVVTTPLRDAEGTVVVLRDTTREREVERMKTEFLSNVSHELRTPLTPIRGYAEILVSKPGLGTDKVHSFATTIRDESLKMNRVVDLLVDVASIEAGRVHVVPRSVSVRELLDKRLKTWQERAPHRAKDLKRRLAAKLPAVQVDPMWVGKALDELIDNAVKYTPAGTPITLVAAMAPEGDRVRVTVRDAGPGIPEGDLAKLFTSFEQVDGSATRRVGGLGLGLSFVRRLADDTGFPLTVASVYGKGSDFSLDLPTG